MKPRCWAAALVLAVAVPAQAAPELYRWIDSDGSVRYTPNPGRVPNTRRGTLVRVEPGMAPPPPAEPPAAVTPAAIHAPPGERVADPFSAPEPPRRALVPAPSDEDRSVDAGPPAPVAAPAEPEVEPHAAPAPVASPGPAAPPAGSPEQELRSRREELVARIAADEETLKTLISRPATEGGDPLVDSEELREIARRLPELHEELRALDEQSARLEPR